MNEWSLMGRGDILLLHTDGLVRPSHAGSALLSRRLEQMLREVKHRRREAIYEAIGRHARVRPADRRHLTRRHQVEVIHFV